MAREGLIVFVCTAPGHLDGKLGKDRVTIYNGGWAYCPHDTRADGHLWTPTGGLTIGDIEANLRRMREHSASRPTAFPGADAPRTPEGLPS